MLVRETYLRQLRPLYSESEIVKVLTGVRRGGKSVLLSQIQDDLKKTIPNERIISLNFEFTELTEISDADSLNDYVLNRVLDPTKMHYIFLDEVQEIQGFERAVNSLRARGNLSVFITGSNSHLLSGEMSTYLSGRYIEHRVWPLSFKESLEIRGIDPQSHDPSILHDYLRWGGMPYRFIMDPSSQQQYLRDVFNSVVLRDIVHRLGLRDVVGLEAIIDFVAENLGRVMSPKSMTGYLSSIGKKVSTDSIYSHLRSLESSLLLNRVRRYDLRGKQVLSTLDKYYATDVGLVQSRRVGSGPGQGDLIENCVFTELARRGFDVKTGVSPGAEIDFVATKGGEPRYLQVAYLVGDGEVADREFGAFKSAKDHHSKYVISMDPFPISKDGIRHISLTSFLLDPPDDLK